MLKSSASFSLHSGNLILINLFDLYVITMELMTVFLQQYRYQWEFTVEQVEFWFLWKKLKVLCLPDQKTNLWSLKELALYRCVVSFSRLLGRLMIVIASNGHFCEMKNINLMPLLELLWVSMFGECLENKAGWLKC